MQQRAADLLQWARRAGNIDRLLPGAGSSAAAAAPQQQQVAGAAANAGSATVTADVGTQPC